MDTNTDARVRLSIGLTAHRDLLPAEVPALRSAVRDFFRSLQAQFPDLPLRLISALAEGGDQLVAEEAVALGIELVVPLPMAQVEYERDFDDPDALARFRRLLAAGHVRVLPLAPGNSAEAIATRGPARNLQYAQQGMFVSSHCQLLLALWDGNPNTATGGTAQVVDFHLHDAMPGLSIEHIAPNLLADDESDLIYHLACSRRLGASGVLPQPAPLQARWITLDGEHPAIAGMPAHYAHVFAQLETFNRDLQRYADGIDATPSHLLDRPLPSALPSNVARIERQFHAADWLAVHFQKRVRMGLACVHVVAALMGLAFILFSDVAGSRAYLVAFLALFATGLVLTLVGNRRQWQRKYLDYRGLAEGLRVQLYWRLADVEIPPDSSLGYDSFLQKQDVDLSWIRHAMRGTGLLHDEAFIPGHEWLQWVVAHWVGDSKGQGGQLAYFLGGVARRERAYALTCRMGDLALVAGLLGAVALLGFGSRLPTTAQNLLLVAMGLLPLLAGIREAYSYKKADKELIKQFRFMSRLFSSCQVRLQRARDDVETRQLLLALGRACLEEHAEWILLHRERPLEHAQIS